MMFTRNIVFTLVRDCEHWSFLTSHTMYLGSALVRSIRFVSIIMLYHIWMPALCCHLFHFRSDSRMRTTTMCFSSLCRFLGTFTGTSVFTLFAQFIDGRLWYNLLGVARTPDSHTAGCLLR